ncbi:putative C6 transcription factor [Cercophora newfieldiana]|uniref:C6 transcription factor n=1 Tax=Cercophora newfieldiana TaxID=92897 RepID=A0AA39Y957_9PEZI|nr:putative C6 transcription factor [Cercophora newfieldiana]
MPSTRVRVLACVLCQQRKIKCDRVFPCTGCIRADVQCVPGSMIARPRKRRFPEKELLSRIRNYEALLRENNVKFEPLHGDPRQLDGDRLGAPRQDSSPSPSTAAKSEYEPKNFWHAMNHSVCAALCDSQEPLCDCASDSSSDDVRELDIKNALQRGFQHSDNLLLGSSEAPIDLSTLHPNPIHIFRLWQIYLENVDPLFKVTHSITLQSRIFTAATNIGNIDAPLEALMFSIYCVAITSLDSQECRASFGASKEDLMTSYRFGCQHALTNAKFLQLRDRDTLTALFLYLVSIGRLIHPQSLCSLCGVAMRIAQHIGIHSEASLARRTPFEAEMCRRLWWALVLFDSRMAETAGCMNVTYLVPSWDCKIPLNVNDSDLRPEMSIPPSPSNVATEAIFAVARAEFGDFIRHAAFQLDFTCPWLKPLAKDANQVPAPDGSVMPILENLLEEKYLRVCDPNNSIHYMTIWMTRAQVARAHLIEHLAKHPDPSTLSETQRNAAFGNALRTLTCNTHIMASPLNKKLRWLVQFYYPLPAYVHILQELKRRPVGEQADKAWAIMTENYKVLFPAFIITQQDRPMFKVFAKPILSAWEICETAARESTGKPPMLPEMVVHARQQLDMIEREEQNGQDGGSSDADLFPIQMSMDGVNQLHVSGVEAGFQVPIGVDLGTFDWGANTWV